MMVGSRQVLIERVHPSLVCRKKTKPAPATGHEID